MLYGHGGLVVLSSVTVAMCTWNPPPIARRCVAATARAVSDAAVPASLLVIDNGRGGAQVTDGVHPRGGVRVVEEPQRGLSHARNRALAEADGDVVVFIDDDIEPAAGWLDAHTGAYESPSVVSVGGPVRLRRPPPGPPRWWTRNFAPYYSALEHGGPARIVGRAELPIGANMSVRRDAALAVGGFSPELGHDGPNMRTGEDSDFARRLLARFPEGIWYEPAAIVYHHVRPDRLRPSWIIRRAAAAGSAEALLLAREGRLHTLSPSQLLRVRHTHRGDALTTRCVDAALRLALAFGYWRGR